MSYTSITIKNIIDGISDNEYVLPAIQREFVWNITQIEKLFDSLMRGYPVGSFLFWSIKKDNVKDYQFYSFLAKYHAIDNCHNAEFNPSGNNDITAILDGQQRLTSLYIGLKGSYSEKKKNARHDNPNAYPQKFLYLNLLDNSILDNNTQNEESSMKYEFKFLTEEESKDISKKMWFKVSDILGIDVAKFVITSLKQFGEEKQASCLDKLNLLKNTVEKHEIITYFEEKEQDLDKVLNIFIRVNSQGTILSYSDLLLSTATATWKSINARENIHTLVDELNNKGMNISSDFIMKSSLMLTDLNIKFIIKNFTRSNMQIIENQWEDIRVYLNLTVSLLQKYGYNHTYISAYNALLPIAYYLKVSKVDYSEFLSNTKYQNDRDTIIKWLRRAFIKQIFSGGSDGTLTTYRDIIKENYKNGFPLNEIEKRFKGKRQDITFTDEDIEGLMDSANYNNKKQLYSVMTAIFPIPSHALEMNIDHMFPKSSMTSSKNLAQWKFSDEKQKDIIGYWCNNISNLQYLEISQNRAKSAQDFASWLNEISKKDNNFKPNQLIPDIDSYAPENFIEFCEKRFKLLLDKLKKNI